MRRRLPWVIALPLMAGGSLAAHAVGSPLVGARPEAGSHEVAERSSAGLASDSVLVLALLAALVVAVATPRLVAFARRRRCPGASPWLFFTLPPLAFGLQELLERLLGAEAAPFRAALEPRFLAGLALQVPFGLGALLAARLFLRVARRIVRALGRPRPIPAVRRPSPVAWLPVACELPRIPALALGYPQRGPPRG